MKQFHAVTWLPSLNAALALVAAGLDLFPFSTLHRLTVQIYERGLYALDTSLVAGRVRWHAERE